MSIPTEEPSASSKAQNKDLKGMVFFAPSKSRFRAKIWIMGISKTSDHIKIKIKMLNPSQELPSPFKAPNKDLKERYVFCTLIIKIESKNSNHGYTKDM